MDDDHKFYGTHTQITLSDEITFSMAVASVVLGVLSMLFGWISRLGIVLLFGAAAGLVLGTVSYSNLKRHPQPCDVSVSFRRIPFRALAVIGVVCCSIGLVESSITTGMSIASRISGDVTAQQDSKRVEPATPMTRVDDFRIEKVKTSSDGKTVKVQVSWKNTGSTPTTMNESVKVQALQHSQSLYLVENHQVNMDVLAQTVDPGDSVKQELVFGLSNTGAPVEVWMTSYADPENALIRKFDITK